MRALGLGTEVVLRDQEGRVVWSLRSGDRGILKGPRGQSRVEP